MDAVVAGDHVIKLNQKLSCGWKTYLRDRLYLIQVFIQEGTCSTLDTAGGHKFQESVLQEVPKPAV